MRRTSIRELHIHTSELVREAAEGRIIVIERCGEPVAELRPFTARPRMPAGKKARTFTSMLADFNEPDSPRIRDLVRKADAIHSSISRFRRIPRGTASPSAGRDVIAH